MFRYPWLFSLFIPLIIHGIHLFRNKKGYSFPSLKTRLRGKASWRRLFWWVPEFWTLVTFGVIIFLLAGPERPVTPEENQSQGLAMAIVLDRSGSMGVTLENPSDVTRFDAVKGVLKDFLSRRTGDGIALLSFALYPETHTPLTNNPEIIQGFLSLIPLAVSESESGTAMGDALVLAAARLKEGRSEGAKTPGVVLLLTDGRQNAGKSTPEEGAKILASLGIKLYAIGLGGKGYYEQSGPFGPVLTGQVVDLDVPGLRAISRLTGGDFFQADDPGQLDQLLKKLETGELARLQSLVITPKTLNLEIGLWILSLLLLSSPLIKFFILKRGID